MTRRIFTYLLITFFISTLKISGHSHNHPSDIYLKKKLYDNKNDKYQHDVCAKKKLCDNKHDEYQSDSHMKKKPCDKKHEECPKDVYGKKKSCEKKHEEYPKDVYGKKKYAENKHEEYQSNVYGKKKSCDKKYDEHSKDVYGKSKYYDNTPNEYQSDMYEKNKYHDNTHDEHQSDVCEKNKYDDSKQSEFYEYYANGDLENWESTDPCFACKKVIPEFAQAFVFGSVFETNVSDLIYNDLCVAELECKLYSTCYGISKTNEIRSRYVLGNGTLVKVIGGNNSNAAILKINVLDEKLLCK